MKRIVSMMVIFTLLLGGMTHVQAQTSKAAEKVLLIYRQTAVWTISRFLCRSFTAYSNFVHTFGIKKQYTVLVSEGEPQIPH